MNFGLDNYLTSDMLGDLDFFIGQSYRVGGNEDNTLIKNPNRQSDIINNLNWQINNNTNINWKYLIDNDTLEENYSNLSLMTKVLDLKITSSHSSINNNFTDGNQDREEFNFKVDKKFGNNWKLGYSSTYDMSNNDTEKIKEKISLAYIGDYQFQNCLSISLTYNNNSTSNNRDIHSENSIFLNFSFRTLGDYEYISNLF